MQITGKLITCQGLGFSYKKFLSISVIPEPYYIENFGVMKVWKNAILCGFVCLYPLMIIQSGRSNHYFVLILIICHSFFRSITFITKKWNLCFKLSIKKGNTSGKHSTSSRYTVATGCITSDSAEGIQVAFKEKIVTWQCSSIALFDWSPCIKQNAAWIASPFNSCFRLPNISNPQQIRRTMAYRISCPVVRKWICPRKERVNWKVWRIYWANYLTKTWDRFGAYYTEMEHSMK